MHNHFAGRRPDFLQVALSPSLEENVTLVQTLLGDNFDFILRRIRVRAAGGCKAAVFFLEEIVDMAAVTEAVLEPLTHLSSFVAGEADGDILADIATSILEAHEVTEQRDLRSLLVAVSVGEVGLLVDGVGP